jgi:hypothetical protein
MRTTRIASLLAVLAALFVSLMVMLPVQAGERLLTVNGGAASEVFFTSGEQTLVMNGFDLTPLEILRPAVIDRVTIVVDTPVIGQPSQLVIYEDVNGGSPIDARLTHQESVNISSSGSVTITLAQPAEILAPVVWIGFYLPPDFKFLADQSGSSVLTYWGWTSGGTFDLANLASAGVLGPGDGSAPVGLDMNGVARITAEITGANPGLGTPVILQSFQTAGDPNADLSGLFDYPDCEDIEYDTADEYVSNLDRINLYCRQVSTWLAPQSPEGFERRGKLYDISIFTQDGVVANLLDAFVTHCIDTSDEFLNSAVVGVAYGVPKVWRILPTQQFGGKWVCAEIPTSGYVSYFTPITSP